MKDPRKVLKTLLISEKSVAVRETNNCYVFEVAKDANKIDIKRAVETLYNVKVAKVTTMNNHGKERHLGRYRPGRTPDWKKAIIKLAKGEAIAEFETL
ncbi:MAG: 50S ribosomal protein L23 [candidate division Zixibacteria bacterium]|nr:50S ribosomal protein L23 [candidate division Zixibacteria bacterium]